MRKALWLMLVLLIAVSVAGVTAAQDATALTLGESVSGEITADSYEIPYTFDGKSGDVALVQMWEAPDAIQASPLDPTYSRLLTGQRRRFGIA